MMRVGSWVYASDPDAQVRLHEECMRCRFQCEMVKESMSGIRSVYMCQGTDSEEVDGEESRVQRVEK